MPDYSQGKIYKIVSHVSDKVYYGSTTQELCQRKQSHLRSYKCYLSGKYHYVTSFDIFDEGDYDFILVENYPCEHKSQLHSRERYHIENNKCSNKHIPNRTHKESKKAYQQKNKEAIKKQYKQYKLTNKEKILQQRKIYCRKNKEKINKQRNQYRQFKAFLNNPTKLINRMQNHINATNKQMNEMNEIIANLTL